MTLFSRLDIYLWKRLVLLVLAVFFVLLTLFIATSLGQLIYVFNQNDLPIHYLPNILLAQIPELFLLIIGISLYIGIIIHLSSLNSSRESVILMAVGLSKMWMVRNVSLFAVPFLCMIAYVSMVLMPQGIEKSRELINTAQNEFNFRFDKESLRSFSDKIMIYVAKKNDDYSYANISMRFNNKDQSSWINAEKGFEYIKNNEKWMRLNNAIIFSEGESVDVTYLEQVDFSMTPYLNININKNSYNSVRTLSTLELLKKGETLERAEFFWRLSYVLSALLFCILAVFIVRYQPRKGNFTNVIPALLIFLLYSKILVLIRDNTEDKIWSPEMAYGLFYICSLLLIYCFWLASENKLNFFKRLNV